MAKKKTTKKPKKLDMYPGGGKVLNNFIQDPSEAMAQQHIDLAKAQYEAKKDPLVMAGKVAGNAAFQYGMNNGGFGDSFLGDMANTGLGLGMPGFAMGGNVQGDVPIEVEKQEVVEAPNGNMMQVDGPSHAQGGVDVNVPEGSMVYSDRIKVDNKSLAKHVAADTKKLDKAKKALEDNPTDKILKESVTRIEANLEKKKAKFQQLQDIFNSNDPSKQSNVPIGMEGQQQFMYGGRAKYYNGGPVKDFYFGNGHGSHGDYLHYLEQANSPDTYSGSAKFAKDHLAKFSPTGFASWKHAPNEELRKRTNRIDDPYAGKMQITDRDKTDVYFASKEQKESSPNLTGASTGSGDYYMSPEHNAYLKSLGITDEDTAASLAASVKVDPKKRFNGMEGMDLTGGDIMGMAGTLYSGIAPMMNTMKNRASDTVNTNMYKDYGKEGMEALSDAERNMRGMFAENTKAIERQGKTSQAQMRSGARGINQLRAGDIATQQGMNQGKNAAWANFAQQQQQLDLQRVGLENQQDQMVMQGAAAADLANRQDRDNYSTQLGADKSNLGAMMQQMGSNLNQNKLGREKMTNLQNYKQMMIDGLISEAAYTELVKDIMSMEGATTKTTKKTAKK